MANPRKLPTPQSIAEAIGWRMLPLGVLAGLTLGLVARAWMRFITTQPEFTIAGTLGIVLGFAIFAGAQSLAAIATQMQWRASLRRFARGLGFLCMLPLMLAAGATMAPAFTLAGAAVWHPRWPRVLRASLASLALLDVVLVSKSIATDHGASAVTVIGIAGLILIYSCITWATAGTFMPPRRGTAAAS